MPAHRPEIVAHRAGPLRNGVARHAEQTLPAFAETWARERVMCELDVRFTADGVPVAFHDPGLQRITGRAGHLHEHDLRAFRALRADVLGADRVLARADAPVPLATLEDVLSFARRSGARLDVELKNLPADPAFDPTPATAERLARLLRRSGIDLRTLIVQSFWAEDVAVLARALPGARHSLLAAPGSGDAAIADAVAAGAQAVGLAWPADRSVVEAAKARGLHVMTYTVNDPAAVVAAARAGVDAIITDDPMAARLALAREHAHRRQLV
jgi:glycerophosphoryl diester phosphodiesterase